MTEYVERTQTEMDRVLIVLPAMVYGAGNMVKRILVGAYEIVTFPIPLPKEYKPVLEPATPFEVLMKASL